MLGSTLGSPYFGKLSCTAPVFGVVVISGPVAEFHVNFLKGTIHKGSALPVPFRV